MPPFERELFIVKETKSVMQCRIFLRVQPAGEPPLQCKYPLRFAGTTRTIGPVASRFRKQYGNR